MTTEDRIKAALLRNPNRDDRHVAKALLVPIAAVRAVRAGGAIPGGGQGGGQGVPAPEVPVNGAGLISLDRIRERYDITAAILQALAKLPHGKLLRESDLCQLTAGSDRTRFRRAVENNADKFREFRVRLRIEDSGDGTFYWGSREDVAEAVRMRDL
jgi:hypothetical protein